MRKKSTILFFLFCLSFHKLLAQDWIFACTDKEGKSKFYMKSTAVNSSSGIVKVWTKSKLPKFDSKKKGKTVIYTNVESKILYEFDCSERKFQIISVLIYNSNGDLIYSYEPKIYELEWKNAVPESIGEILLDKACDLFNQE